MMYCSAISNDKLDYSPLAATGKNIIAIAKNMFGFRTESGRYSDRPYVTSFVGRGTAPAHSNSGVSAR